MTTASYLLSCFQALILAPALVLLAGYAWWDGMTRGLILAALLHALANVLPMPLYYFLPPAPARLLALAIVSASVVFVAVQVKGIWRPAGQRRR